MAAVKYDVEDVEAGGGGEEPQPATYPGKIVSMVHRKKKNNSTEKISDFEITVDIGKEYVRLWTYVKLPDDPNYKKESHGWKLRELTDALGLPPKGEIDPVKISKQQPAVLVKVTSDTHRDSGEYRGKVKNLFPPSGAEKGDDTPADSDSSGEEGPYPREEMEGWSDEDIRGYASELGLDDITGRGWKAKLLDAIISAQDEAAEGGDGGDDSDDGETGEAPALDGVDPEVAAELNTDPAHYADWSDEDVKWMVEGLGIDGNVKTSGRGWKAKAIEAIVEMAGGSAEDTTDADTPEAEPDDYDDEETWPDADLKAEIEERREQGADIKIAGRATRAKMIEALRKDNENAEPF